MKRSLVVPMLIGIASCSNTSPDQSNVVVQANDEALFTNASCSAVVTVAENVPSDTSPVSELNTGCGGPLTSAIGEPGLLPTGSGTISLLGLELVVDGATVEVLENGGLQSHSSIQLSIHDGEVRIVEQRSESEQGIYWGIYAGSFALSVELASSTSDQFEVGTFEYIDVDNANDSTHIGQDALFNGVVVYDSNGSGKIDSQDEFMEVVAGNLSITGDRPNWSVTLDLTLTNGETMTGQFDGDFIDIPGADADLL